MSTTSERDLAIALERALGRSRAQVARRHRVSVKTVSRATARVKSRNCIGSEADLKSVHEYVIRLRAAIEDLGLARAAATNPRTLVASVRAQRALLSDEVRLLVELGFLSSAKEQMIAELGEHLLRAARRDELADEFQGWLRGELDEFSSVQFRGNGTSMGTKVSRRPSRTPSRARAGAAKTA